MVDPFENISPLPAEIRHGLIAMACIGITSFVTSTLLFTHITYKLVLWKIRNIRHSRRQLELVVAPVPAPRRNAPLDLNMGLPEDHYYRAKGKFNQIDDPELSYPHQGTRATETPRPHEEPQPPTASPASSTRGERPPNPLLLLIYNLLLADITMSVTYVANVSWLRMDMIYSPSPQCTLQGFMVSFGCLTTSGFLFAISIFSYLGIIRGYKATTRDVIIACCVVWVSSIVLGCLGPIYYHDQSLYGRETMWCWISEKRKLWRLTVYVWGFSAMGLTMAIYTTIFYKLWREGRSSRFMPRRRRESDSTQLSAARRAAMTGSGENPSTALRPSGHHPAFLIYPCIYSFTGTPLILGSLIPALERNVYFMTTAGSLFALTGLLDTILWSSIILFSKKEDLAYAGLDQFSFVRTPEGRTLGNIVLVQGGGGGGGQGNNDRRSKRQSWQSKKDKGWWRLRERNSSQISISRAWNTDQERGSYGIQMEVVTSVVVESEGSQSITRNMSRQRDTSMDSLK